jgi:Flp pilus assembly protein TadG
MAERVTANFNGRKILTGQAVVEMALILPFLLFVIVTALELGRVFYTKIAITNAAREGAYYLSMNPIDSENCSGIGADRICYLNTRLAVLNEVEYSGVVLADSDISCEAPGDDVTVTVSATVDNLFLIGLMSNGMSIHVSNSSIRISAFTKMVAQ